MRKKKASSKKGSGTGKYMAKISLKSRPYVIKKNKLYTIEEDNEGYQIVKRYKITWKI
jgi:hypothetical protein